MTAAKRCHDSSHWILTKDSKANSAELACLGIVLSIPRMQCDGLELKLDSEIACGNDVPDTRKLFQTGVLCWHLLTQNALQHRPKLTA